MKKLIATTVVAALLTLAAGAASAMPGSGVDSKMAGPSVKIDASPGSGPQWKPTGGGAKGGVAGGQATDPGDAFYPGGTSGNVKRDCLFAGGTPKSVVADGAVTWLCL